MIRKVSSNIDIQLIVGGGISTPQNVYDNSRAGANLIVVGNAIERDPMMIRDLAQASKHG
jgi:putative glycerol-1-phosphate prenyltransferase